MEKFLLKFWSQHTVLVIGIGISTAFLTLFLLFQYNDSSVLKLESRWLLVAAVPLLAALIVGGYIKSFKGFGVELEASLIKPVTNIELLATEAMDIIIGDEKRNIDYLRKLASGKKNISRLILVQGRLNYYHSYVLETYLRTLESLKYIEIRNQQGQFVALIPISVFKDRSEISNNVLDEFINVLEKSQIFQRYSSSETTTHINEDTEIIEALKIMRRHKIKQIVVLDKNRVFQGVLTAKSVENKIVENVLQVSDSV